MTTRIGLIGSVADRDQLQALLADDVVVVQLDVSQAEAAVNDDEVALLVIGPDETRADRLDRLLPLREAMTRQRIMALALVAAGDPVALDAAFDAGVADCAAHPIDRGEIRARVRALLRRKANADLLRAEASEAWRLAHTDPVTGLWNRHYLDAELAAALSRARGTMTPLTLLMIDIDGFKPINDRHGHAAGDRVLRAVSARLSAHVRGVDTVARFGGDEIVVLMPGVQLFVARAIAERLRGLVADTPVLVSLRTTISIGVAEMMAGDDPLALLTRADVALYSAKIAGRNRVAAAA